MYIEILKHEFTHDLENRGGYTGFKNYLFKKSLAFSNYCESVLEDKYGELATDNEAIRKLTDHIYEEYKNSDELTAKEKAAFDMEAAEREIVANFVGEVLLEGKNENEAINAIKELSQYQRSFVERLMDWLKGIIEIIKGGPHNKTIEADLRYLNERLAKVYDSAVNITETSGTEKHSIKVTRNMSWEDQLRNVENANLKRSDALYIGEYDSLKLFGLDNHPLAINQSDYRKSRRKSGNNKHYSSHGIPLKFFKNIKEHINNSCMLIDNGEKATLITDYIMSDTNSEPSLVILGIQRNQKMNEDDVNQIFSVYPFDDFSKRIIMAAENGKLIMKNKNKANEQLARVGIQPSERDKIINLAKDSLPQNTTTVKENSADGESHYISSNFSEEHKAERYRSFSESVVKKFGGDIDVDHLTELISDINSAAESSSWVEALEKAKSAAKYILDKRNTGEVKGIGREQLHSIFKGLTDNLIISSKKELRNKFNEAAGLINDYVDNMFNEEALSKADKLITEIAEDIAYAPEKNSSAMQELKDVKEYIKRTRIKLPKEYNGDFDEGLNNFRKKHMGRLLDIYVD